MHWRSPIRAQPDGPKLITILNLSPAVDVTFEVDQLIAGRSHRVTKSHRKPGGKGVNVARILSTAGIENQLVLPLGGASGAWIERELSDAGQLMEVIHSESESRTSVAVMDGAATVFNETAPNPTKAELSQVNDWLASAPVADVCIVSGSMPSALLESEIAALFKACRDHARKLVIDTSGKNLLIAAKSAADLVKPNRDEIIEATGVEDLREAAMSLIELGAKSVLTSLGEDGAELHDRNGYLSATLTPALGNPTGAGDAMTAASGWALFSGMASTELLKYACAAGMLAVREPVAGQLDWTALAGETANVSVEGKK